MNRIEKFGGQKAKPARAQSPRAAWAQAVTPYITARTEVQSAVDWARKVARAVFTRACQALFEAHPNLQSFAWRQFLEFSCDPDYSHAFIGRYHPDINGTNGCDIAGKRNWDEQTGMGEPTPEAVLQHAVAGLLNIFVEDDLISLFGLDVWVTVHRDGNIQTEEYVDERRFDADCGHTTSPSRSNHPRKPARGHERGLVQPEPVPSGGTGVA
jgi:hypothetical protein